MKPQFISSCVFAVILLLLTACHKEIYDPEALSRDYFIQDIPENFDWATTSNIALKVIPDDRYDSRYNYTIEVFGENPLLNETAPLYTIGWATGRTPFRKDIIIPGADSVLFIRQTSPGGRKCLKTIPVNRQGMTCDFSNNGLVKNKNAVLATKSVLPEIPENVPAGAIEITGNKDQTLSPHTNYVIRGTFNHRLFFPGEGNCTLYITGTWNVPSSEISLNNNCKIYILNNGKLLPQKSLKIRFYTRDQVLGIAHGGQLGAKKEDDGIDLFFHSDGYLINEGIFYGNDIKTEAAGSIIINRGKFYLGELSTSDNEIYFHNECYASIDEVNFCKATLYIAPHCAFICKEMNMTHSNITLEESAMLKVKELETKWGGRSIIKGTGHQPSLVKIKELKVESNQPSLQFWDNLHVAIVEKPTNKKAYTVHNNCVIEDAESGPSLEIKPGECTEGNEYTPEEPEKPEFPQVVTYNQSYTYASEDNFPNPGDYDMNDLVISLDSFSHRYQSEGLVDRLIWHLTLRAVGASRQLGAAIQIDHLLPGEIKSVSYSKNTGREIFRVNASGTEQQDSTVIPLFDNAHQLLGYGNTTAMINTRSLSSDKVAPCSFEVIIEFSNPVKDTRIGLDKFNYFTIVGNKPEKRVEIHQPHYNHSGLSNTPAKQQVATKELMWTIKVPGLFRYPEEWTSIKNAYPQFEAWVQSDGKSFTDWYNYAESGMLYKE